MATENKGVMVYLPKDVEEYITSFCTEYNITRKDKEGNVLPSLGTGVVTYLKSQIAGENPSDILTKPSRVSGIGLSREEVLDLIREYNTSHVLSNGLTKDEVIDLIQQSITNSHLPQLIGANDIEVALEPIKESVSELETYTQSQFAAVRDELKAISNRSVTTESTDTTETTPAKTTPLKEGEYTSFAQLAKQLGYSTPNGVKATNPRKEGADDLIAFAASLGQSYGWDGKKQKFYRTDVN
jgi:hypothetical protein